MSKKNKLKPRMFSLIFLVLTLIVAFTLVYTSIDAKEELIKRVVVVKSDGTCIAKDGVLNSQWVTLSSNISSVEANGNRIIVYKQDDGYIYAKDGELSSQWIRLKESSKGLKLNSLRIAALSNDNTLWVKEGCLNNEWVNVTENVKTFELGEERIAALTQEGTLWIKDGPVNNFWLHLGEEIKEFQINGSRIGIIKNDGNFLVKDGSLQKPWISQLNDIKSFKIEDDRIAVLTKEDLLMIKEGELDNDWITIAENVLDYKICGKRIAYKNKNNELFIKEGEINSKWLKISSEVSDFQFDNDRIGVVINGILYVKEGKIDSQWIKLAYNVKQFRLTQYKREIQEPVAAVNTYAPRGSVRERFEYLFGPDKRGYSTREEALSNMTDVTVPIWIYQSYTNKKVASKAVLTVNKKLANDVKSIFETIFNDKEQFPIIDVHSFRWPDEFIGHPTGSAIDINYAQNFYQKYNSNREVILQIGEFWKPRECIFSVTPDGSVVRAFKSHGWYWGGDWNNPKDYMHFSYLGV